MDRTAERQEQFGKEMRQQKRKENAEALFKIREKKNAANLSSAKNLSSGKNLSSAKKVSKQRSATVVTDLDKSVQEIEELLSENFGSDPFLTSADHHKSDSDFEP